MSYKLKIWCQHDQILLEIDQDDHRLDIFYIRTPRDALCFEIGHLTRTKAAKNILSRHSLATRVRHVSHSLTSKMFLTVIPHTIRQPNHVGIPCPVGLPPRRS